MCDDDISTTLCLFGTFSGTKKKKGHKPFDTATVYLTVFSDFRFSVRK